ncbi:hypothetical protein [Escherichia coli]|uniref:hypothetical protein n=1 Tax=Escherichia coli TaxID=562 RepID=UPI002FCD6A11
MKKEEDKQEAAASINAAAGTQLNSDWVETVTLNCWRCLMKQALDFLLNILLAFCS